MGTFHFRTWTATPHVTNDFLVQTKIQNFGDFYSKKSVLGFIVNIGDNLSSVSYNIRLSYRTGENTAWIPLRTLSQNSGTGNTEFKVLFQAPIKNISNFQLALQGRLQGSVAINDISVIYRVYRSTSIGEL